MTTIELPTTIATERLLIRRPTPEDAARIYHRYASDPEVTTYMSWPRHEDVTVTRDVVNLWTKQWQGNTGGAYLITDNASGEILGSTGLDLLNRFVATTGYVLARDSWGKGYATETTTAIVAAANAQGLQRLFAYCHHEHRASAHVLEKCGFEFEGTMRNHTEFPNLSPGTVSDVLLYAWIPGS